MRNLCFLYEPKAELQKQQQEFVAQRLVAAQRHVAVTHHPQPQKATIVYRSQPVPSLEPAKDKEQAKGGLESSRQRGRSGRHHDGRYTSGKKRFCMIFSVVFFSHGLAPLRSIFKCSRGLDR